VPREVFAEEIEGFLERLETVTAARVVANEAGEIERIYVTTESGRDDAGIRRAITAALISQFNLPVEGWRVQIAHLEPAAGAEQLPVCHLIRLEETISEAMTKVVVDLRYEREGAQKTTTGSAQAAPGQVHRLRTVALATLEALRPLLDRAGARATLEALPLLPFAGATVAMVALSIATDRAGQLQVGAEPVTASEAEAVVQAVLDAAQKPARLIPPAGRAKMDRQSQGERLRRHYEGLIRSAQEPGAAAYGADATGREPARPEAAPEPPSDQPPPAAGPRVATLPQTRATSGPPQTHEAMLTDADVVRDMAEIRPELQGGAATVMREEYRHDGSTVARVPPKMSMEDGFYRRLVMAGAPVYIRCRDGYEIPSAIVRDFGTYCLMVEVNGIQELVFKHGIIAIRPYSPLPAESEAPS
jgi:sRNA-binding regulator protein Hfq